MANNINLLPEATLIIIHTGNIINWNSLKKKVSLSPEEELLESLEETIIAWIGKNSGIPFKGSDIECINSSFVETISPDERDQIKLTVKIFMYNFQPAALREAIHKAMHELKVSLIDSVILSFPDIEDNLTLEHMKPLWKILEELIDDKKISQLGVSDLNKDQLEALLNWATVKPTVDQVNLVSCCVMPTELTELAKEKEVLLLTHSDSKLILSSTNFCNILGRHCCGEEKNDWEPYWVVRYSALAKFRGVLITKGYIIAARRDTS